ncbi:MAG: ATP synthase F1 subunit gamma [Chloroflexi bacterium]|nr:ATP synthase F1 subunit gamma [Chloroflexota bacterium]
MANIRIIRRRIRSVQNTAKITKAMQMIAASKMRRAQERVLAGRPYSSKMQEVLADLAAQIEAAGEAPHPLMARRPVRKTMVIHVTPDRGMCGGLNSTVNRRTGQFILQEEAPVTLVTVGRKGRDFMVRYGRDVKAVFTDLGDRPRLADTLPISHIAIEDYSRGEVDRVCIAYARFINTAIQTPEVLQLLPVESAEVPPSQRVGYIYEPHELGVLSGLLPRFVEMQVYHAILESIASEQSARMVAMRNATDNAREMIDSLTLELNKARQDSITRELLDIVGGVSALEG